jgi:ribosome maturation factor RimP
MSLWNTDVFAGGLICRVNLLSCGYALGPLGEWPERATAPLPNKPLWAFFIYNGQNDTGLRALFLWLELGEAMKMPDRLTRLVEPVVADLGFELVGVEFDTHQRILRVYIDCERGVVVDDCSKVSHQLSGLLDVEDPIPGNYHLEISSPGMDRPLFTPEHFERFQGALARIQLTRPIDGRRRFKGRLLGMAGDKVLLADGDERFELPFDSIDRARLVPEFENSKNHKD